MHWRWLAVAGVLLVAGVGGAEISRLTTAPRRASPITRSASDLFDAPIELGAGSEPAVRIYESRLHSYRDALLRGRRMP